MKNGDAELLRTLAALRAQYVAEAPVRVDALRAALESVAGGETAALGELKHLFHRMAGSGGAYGLQAVTDTARAGELAVHALQQSGVPPAPDDLRTLDAHVSAVAGAFREAGATL